MRKNHSSQQGSSVPRSISIVLVLLLIALSAAAQQRPKGVPNPLVPQPAGKAAAPAPAQPQQVPAQMTADDVAAFLDGVVPQQIERSDIAGAVVVVVKDGKVLFAKGYGYADREKKTPVSAGATLFRVGSISKLFTWTAVMQLVEQGKIDLDRNVNDYLDFKIPATFPQPITMRDLMTHTPGFEEAIKDLLAANARQMTPLGTFLRTHIPARIFPPFKVPAYSNYGAALAGYIVERVSGEKFEDYVRDHILQPLGMTNASFEQPLPSSLEPQMSKGYKLGSGKTKPFELIPASPAGALSVSGLDIARFMIAHLQNGQYEGHQILQPATVQMMHSRQFGLVPQMNGMCLGFYEESRNGHRIIGHGGDTVWFHSDLHLVPDQNLGFFISQNSAGKGGFSLRSAVWEKFLDRYYPYQPPAAKPPSSKMADAKQVSGDYIASRRSQTNFMYLFSLIGEMQVSAQPDGTIEDGSLAFNGQPKKFEEIAPLLYREVDGQDMVGFVHNGPSMEVAIDFPAEAFQSVPWYKQKNFVLFLLVGSAAVFALTLIFWVIAALVRRHYARALEYGSLGRTLRLLTRIECLIALAAFCAWALIVIRGMGDLTRFNPGLDPWIHLAHALTIIGVLGTLVALLNMAWAWINARWWWTKLWETLITLACLAFVFVAVLGNLWGWGVRY